MSTAQLARHASRRLAHAIARKPWDKALVRVKRELDWYRRAAPEGAYLYLAEWERFIDVYCKPVGSAQ
jgi:hypothetical protein